MKTEETKIKIRAAIAFVLTFAITAGCIFLINQSQERKEKLKATYAAESTIGRIEAKVNEYLADSNLMKRIVEAGYELDDEKYAVLSRLMLDDNNVIEAVELAKDGTVSQIYPMEGNEEAMGLNMLVNPARKEEAQLAKGSGQYTIAGPFELVQGGTGVLLFDPVYQKGVSDEEEFWGFSILVLNWDKFLKEVEPEQLEDAGYHYRIWKKDLATGKQKILLESGNEISDSAMQVKCSVPNDTWYFEIEPIGGWVPLIQKVISTLLALLAAFVVMIVYLQHAMRRYKEEVYTEQIQESAKREKAANEAKTRFLFNMSHDMRTPMNAIIGFSDLLEEHINDQTKVADYIGKIKSSGTMLLSLINYVLETARIESGKISLKTEVGCLKELLHSLQVIFEPSVEAKKLSFELYDHTVTEYVLCDRTKIHEILVNIISNAIKYTPEGGKVVMEVQEKTASKDGYVGYEYVVEDTGIGMSEEYLPHIFEEFSREHSTTESKVAGAGLGLPIVKSLIDLMGGTIDVQSQIGKGTRITIYLEFQKATEEQVQNAAKTVEISILERLKGTRILLAEDNELNAEIVTTILEEHGFEVICTEDGVQCLEKLKEMPEHYFDAILMDIQMPRMNGYEASKVIRKLDNSRAQIPIIALTANAFEEDKRSAFEAGVNAHVAKPVNMDELLNVLSRLVRTK